MVMKYMPRISVIVPVYNVEKYLHRCVDSILGQTFTDFELILVDDGSPDNCGAICDEYAAKDARVRVIHQENQGQAAARNRAVAEANGEWIHFVDSDDVIHPQMLEVLYCAAVENHANISMCGAIESEEISEAFYSTPNRHVRVRDIDEESMEDLLDHGEHRYWVVWGKLIRKRIVQKLPFTQGRIYEDNAIVCQWLQESGKIADIEDRLYFYLINCEGTTKKISVKKIDRLWALNEQVQFYQKIGYEHMKSRICSRYIKSASSLFRDFVDDGDLQEAAKMLKKQMWTFWREKRSAIALSSEEQFFVLENLYPGMMRYFWMARKGIHCLKENFLRK